MSKTILINRKSKTKKSKLQKGLVAAAEYDYPDEAYWEGVIGVENQLTGDGRFIEKNALRWETPIPVRHVTADVGAHDGAQVIGKILEIERRGNGIIWAHGSFDMNSEAGKEAYRQVAEELTTGVSMDLDETSFEVRIAKEIVDKVLDADEDSEEIEEELKVRGDRVVITEGAPDDEIFAVVDGLIRAATIVAIPAFKDAKIGISAAKESTQSEKELEEEENSDEIENGDEVEKESEDQSEEALVASAIPNNPPAEWFDNPNLTAPTALTVDDDGRIFGHLAAWGVCHIGNPTGKGICVEAPTSPSNYAYFHTGALKLSNGNTISVGQITMTANHAHIKDSATRASSHYDHTGAAVADVRVGEDSHGIWVAGALRPGVTAQQIRELRASPLSGDWRVVAGNMELVAALAVNVPGFPIPRTEGLVASGEVVALVAAGMVVDENITETDGLSALDIAYLKRLAKNERLKETEDLANRVLAIRNRNKVKLFVKDRD